MDEVSLVTRASDAGGIRIGISTLVVIGICIETSTPIVAIVVVIGVGLRHEDGSMIFKLCLSQALGRP